MEDDALKVRPTTADRRWRRRPLLVMCITRHRRREAQLRNDAAGDASDGWIRVTLWMLGPGKGKDDRTDIHADFSFTFSDALTSLKRLRTIVM